MVIYFYGFKFLLELLFCNGFCDKYIKSFSVKKLKFGLLDKNCLPIFVSVLVVTIKILSAEKSSLTPHKALNSCGVTGWLAYFLHWTIYFKLSLCIIISTPPSPLAGVTSALKPFFLNTSATSCSNCKPLKPSQNWDSSQYFEFFVF